MQEIYFDNAATTQVLPEIAEVAVRMMCEEYGNPSALYGRGLQAERAIKEAREQGDLSENAEYDAAKDEQRDIEARIEEIEKILKNAEVVVEDEVDLDKISVGCKVKVHDFEFEEDIELKIVGSTEANSLEGKISNESPVGKALIGAHTGDVVEVEMPAGIMKYKVLEIQRNV